MRYGSYSRQPINWFCRLLGNWYLYNARHGELHQMQDFRIRSKYVNIGWNWSQWFCLTINRNIVALAFFGFYIDIF